MGRSLQGAGGASRALDLPSAFSSPDQTSQNQPNPFVTHTEPNELDFSFAISITFLNKPLGKYLDSVLLMPLSFCNLIFKKDPQEMEIRPAWQTSGAEWMQLWILAWGWEWS